MKKHGFPDECNCPSEDMCFVNQAQEKREADMRDNSALFANTDFGRWVPTAYRDAFAPDAQFTVHNMAVAYMAGQNRSELRHVERVAKAEVAQAAVSEDARMLDWLAARLSDRDFREIGLSYRCGDADIRPAIRAAMSADGAIAAPGVGDL